MRSSLLYLGFLVGPATGCMRTATSPITTTTVATTKAATKCNSCTNGEISTAVTGTNGKAFASDVTSTSGMCLTRTLTCTGSSPTITINGGPTTVTDGGTGTASITVTCDSAGTGWITADGTMVTSLSCAASLCGNCDPNTIMLTMTEMGTQAFSSDTTSMQMGTGCLQRTLTCTGNMATIDVNGGANGAIGDSGAGSVTTTAVCAANGKDWLIDGVNDPITQLECTAVTMSAVPCQNCPRTAVMSVKNEEGAVDFSSITFDPSGMCLTETFVCTGNEASVQVNNGDAGTIADTDQGTPGMVTLTLTCNNDAMTFAFMGITITTLECDNFP